jgi:hypothetical protein
VASRVMPRFPREAPGRPYCRVEVEEIIRVVPVMEGEKPEARMIRERMSTESAEAARDSPGLTHGYQTLGGRLLWESKTDGTILVMTDQARSVVG